MIRSPWLSSFVVLALALGAPACAPETVVIVLPAVGSEAPDASIFPDASRAEPPDGAGTGPIDGASDAEASQGDSGVSTPADAARADASHADADVPKTDAGYGADASMRDASAPLPDPGPYGCPEAPFNADGTVCLVDDPCTAAATGNYLASGSLQCMSDGDAEYVTCEADSPYRRYPAPVPASQLLRVTTFAPFPFRLRTPQVTGPHQACAPDCAGTASVATGVMRFALALPFADDITVHVGPPWKVAVDVPQPFCPGPAVQGTPACLRKTMQTATITVYTTEVYAPSREVLVDVAARTNCP